MLRVGIVCDLEEEGWPSMDLVGEMLVTELQAGHTDSVQARRLMPGMVRRFSGMSVWNDGRFAKTADRLLNRFWDYPRWLLRRREEFDLFHIVDHSYAHLAHVLPAERTVITCHDVDAFRSLLKPARDVRTVCFRPLAKRVLAGLRKAARVTCPSAATRDELVGSGLLRSDQIVVIPYGVHPACSPEPDARADVEAASLLGESAPESVEILHVGSTIPRKRIDVLLRVFANVKAELRSARLLRVGGPFTRAQQQEIRRLGIAKDVVVLPFLTASVLAAVYRRATLVLLTSEQEGFGLPVIEALACGTPVVASDVPALREVGGEAVTYCPVRDIERWAECILHLLRERATSRAQWAMRQHSGIAQARKFSWAEFARKVVSVYQDLLSGRN